MAYVALARADRRTRLTTATTRWDAILQRRPDLEPAVALQRRLIGLIVDLADTIEHARLPRLSLPPKYLAAKLSRRIPALAGEPIPLPVAALKPTMLRLCEELSKGGAGAAADHIRTALDETQLDAGALLTASLARDQKAIRSAAAHRGLAADLLWLVAELAVSPFAYALEQALLAPASSHGDEHSLEHALAEWSHSYCPACGSRPALAEVTNGRRVLRCSFCALAWDVPGSGCVYCGDSEKLAVLMPTEERTVELCGACGAYLKAVRVSSFSPFPLIAIGDLETIDLDMAATEKGHARPPLPEFPMRR